MRKSGGGEKRGLKDRNLGNTTQGQISHQVMDDITLGPQVHVGWKRLKMVGNTTQAIEAMALGQHIHAGQQRLGMVGNVAQGQISH